MLGPVPHHLALPGPACPASLPITTAALDTWLAGAAPGQRITYHRGFLARDTSALTFCLPEAERLALLSVAIRAWTLAEAGFAHLVQCRHGDEDYAYLLIARRRPKPARLSLRPVPLLEAA